MTLVIVLGLFGSYLTFGPMVLGPKSAVGKACHSITLGMDLTAAAASARQAAMDVATYDDQLQISQVDGDWICICKATLDQTGTDNAQVTSVDKVFCVD